MIKVIWNVIKKIFGVIFMIFSPLKRLWCRRKRRNSDPILPMSNHYPSVENLSSHYSMNGTGQVQEELSPWDSWDEQKQAEKIRSVEEYRQRQLQLQQQQSQENEPEMDYFQDMTPKVKKQKKVLVKKKEDYTGYISDKLAMTADIPMMQNSELGSWEESGNAWEAEADDDLSWQADNVIKEKRKAERQQRHLQQQLKKQEREQQKQFKSHNPLTAVRLS
ncbi:receptor-binding cancer antigen expressed on SiSo cells-like [Ruditapes philippinarum]|nr:receptor-binding cancer antigen expressed on SiSo cells-like [Ruditapes philippinarum]